MWRHSEFLCLWCIHERQSRAVSIDVVSSKSKLPDSYAAMIFLVDLLAPHREYPSDKLDLHWASSGGKALSDGESLKCCRIPSENYCLSTMITNSFLALLLRRLPQRFDCSTFTASFCCGHLSGRSRNDSNLRVKASEDACWCSTN